MKLDKRPNEDLRRLGLIISFGLMIAAIVTGWISFLVNGSANPLQWWAGWFQDLGTEMLGAAVTIFLVELIIYQKRDEASRVDSQRKQRRDNLVEQLKFARTPMRRQRILEQLKKHNLLPGAWLYEFNLQQANLNEAEMQEVDLDGADLQEAQLNGADLEEANLRKVNLERAMVKAANLQGVELSYANLKGANLEGANLQDAELEKAKFDEMTILPDGKTWNCTTDMGRFVDPQHPNFWKKTDAKLPPEANGSVLLEGLKSN